MYFSKIDDLAAWVLQSGCFAHSTFKTFGNERKGAFSCLQQSTEKSSRQRPQCPERTRVPPSPARAPQYLKPPSFARLRRNDVSASEWREALAHDTEAAHRLIDDFAADLALVTDRRVLRTRTLQLPLAENSQGWPDAKHAARLWESFQRRLWRFVSACVAEVQYRPSWSGSDWNDAARFGFPADPIVWTGPGTCTFSWLGSVETRNRVTLAETVTRDALDYTGFLPRRARRKLDALARTYFDYQPAVVEGTLVEEHVDDPALALRLGEGFPDLAVDYWRSTKRERRELWCKAHGVLCALLALAVLFLMIGAGIGSIGMTPIPPGASFAGAVFLMICGGLIAAIALVPCVILTRAWWLARRPLRL